MFTTCLMQFGAILSKNKVTWDFWQVQVQVWWILHNLAHARWQGMLQQYCWNIISVSSRNITSSSTVADNQSPPILRPWVFLFRTRQEHLQRLGNAGKHLFRVYWRYWHEPMILKLNIYLFEPPNFGRPPKQLAKNAEKCAINSFLKLKMIPQILDNFHEPFSRYMTSKVTFSHPNIEYLSSHLRLRKFWQCENSIVRTIQCEFDELFW